MRDGGFSALGVSEEQINALVTVGMDPGDYLIDHVNMSSLGPFRPFRPCRAFDHWKFTEQDQGFYLSVSDISIYASYKHAPIFVAFSKIRNATRAT